MLAEQDPAAHTQGVATRYPEGCVVGMPVYDPDTSLWRICGFDERELPEAARATRVWTAEAVSEAECIREMARCLREITEGRVLYGE